MRFFFKEKIKNTAKGFTLVELIVSISIFVIITTLVVVKYNNFSSSTFLTNVAYDIALIIREAQSYGINVKSSVRLGTAIEDFTIPFGVVVSMSPGADNGSPTNKVLYLFRDLNANGGNGRYEFNLGEAVSKYSIKRNYKINSISIICSETGSYLANNLLFNYYQIIFKRPSPVARITDSSGRTDRSGAVCTYKQINIRISDDQGTNFRTVKVNNMGLISVE